jgi:hypothetical protein
MQPARDTTELDRLTAAFPAYLTPQVRSAIRGLPTETVFPEVGRGISEHSIDSSQAPVGVFVDGEPVSIPYRIYHSSVPPDRTGLDGVEREILGCLYTRHHVGETRQAWLSTIVGAAHPWVVPFVVQLVGEYVVEILVEICRGLPDLGEPGTASSLLYGQFLAENPGFLFLTRQRVSSYWDCYHRGAYLHAADYPGHELIRRLEASVRIAADAS